MNFTLTDKHELIIEATTAKEVAEICKHFNRDITRHTDELVAGKMTCLAGTGKDGKRPWFHQVAHVPFDFLKPYYDLLEKVTGYTGPAFTIGNERLRYPGGYAINLCHTHIVVNATIDTDGYHAEGFIAAEDWNVQTAEQRAKINFAEYLRKDLGATKHEPEYIKARNNHMVRNPNYMKHHAPHPAATSVAIIELIFDHWLVCYATEAQRALWAEGDACHRSVCRDSLAASMLRNYSNSFHVENYKRTISFDEFKALGNQGEQP